MLRHLLPVMAALFSAVPVQAETVEGKCVQIGDMQHRLEETRFGGSELVWEVAVENHCDLPVDLVLNLHLQDAQDNRLYSSRQVVIVNAGERRTTSKRTVVPSRVLADFSQVQVDTEERARPL